MYSWFGCLLDYFIINQYINDDIAQSLSFKISTVLKTATYLKFCYIKRKNAKQREEKKMIKFLRK